MNCKYVVHKVSDIVKEQPDHADHGLDVVFFKMTLNEKHQSPIKADYDIIFECFFEANSAVYDPEMFL